MDKLIPLPLNDLLGIPIADLIKAETHAAEATTEFIEKIGFNPPAKGDQIGNLRLITFNYYEIDLSGKQIQREVQIPLLSLVPIPVLQIERAEIDFNVSIEGMSKIEKNTQLNSFQHKLASWLSAERFEFYGKIDTLETNVNEKIVLIPKMKVKIEVKQSDLPTGLTYLFRKMDENSRDSKK